MRTHLHTTLNKSRDERTETAGEDRGTRRGDPAAVDVWLSDWLSVAKILRIPGIGSIPLLRDSIPPLRVSIPLLAALDVWLSDWLSVAKIFESRGSVRSRCCGIRSRCSEFRSRCSGIRSRCSRPRHTPTTRQSHTQTRVRMAEWSKALV